MTYKEILSAAKKELTALDSHLIDVIEIKKPPTLEYAKNLAKVISKLSPMLGNMIEFSTVDMLNRHKWEENGNQQVSGLDRILGFLTHFFKVKA